VVNSFYWITLNITSEHSLKHQRRVQSSMTMLQRYQPASLKLTDQITKNS